MKFPNEAFKAMRDAGDAFKASNFEDRELGIAYLAAIDVADDALKAFIEDAS